MLFDTHAHLLDRRFDPDRDEVITEVKAQGVSLIVEAGTTVEESKRACQLANQHDFIYFTAGVHPHGASKVKDDFLDKIAELLHQPKCVAVGEIGLDYYRNLSPRQQQQKVFAELLDLAIEYNKPVVIHDREAHGDVFSIVHQRKNKLKGVLHCYSGSLESAKQYIRLGFYISFSGTLTYKNATNLKRTAANIPLEYIMCETDSPYLSPEPERGRRNDPSKVKHVVAELARIKGIPFEQAAEITKENGKKLFGIERRSL
jgi:TatD DNase family protein